MIVRAVVGRSRAGTEGGAMADTHGGASHYFVPAPSQWPLVGSVAMLFTMFGLGMVVNHNPLGWYSLAIGLATLIYMMIGWFGAVSAESSMATTTGLISFRWG
jgi:cytochrome c oxidase subunit 3